VIDQQLAPLRRLMAEHERRSNDDAVWQADDAAHQWDRARIRERLGVPSAGRDGGIGEELAELAARGLK
jgi:hypothetical protein